MMSWKKRRWNMQSNDRIRVQHILDEAGEAPMKAQRSILLLMNQVRLN
jgi:hypothetical protein